MENLSLEVNEGEVFAFLGANGAGKTTTIKILLDFLKPTSGEACIFGVPVSIPAARARIGYLPEQPYFQKFLTPMEVMGMHAALLGIPRRQRKPQAMDILRMTGIADYADTPISKLSKGLTQRVGISQALVGDPKLLILDEPASGLDPIGRRHIRDLLSSLRNRGKTIFLSSHLLSEIESVCDRVAILSHGKLVASGTPESIKKSEPFLAVATPTLPAEASLMVGKIAVRMETQENESVISIESERVFELMRLLEKYAIPPISVMPTRESLEDAFLRLAA